ncbi:hypothetical protein BDR26DRAFT_859428 [Obelidium mucronatum]|nr:hypothetical protein BDR26DRAFT_859428 [Obelidium mucronatum]
MYTQMSTTYTLSTLPVVILLDAPFIHMFKEPYFSTSLSDFWSHRWNYPIKETMHRLGFLPTLQALSAFDSRKNGITQKPPMYHLAIASFAAFVASAIFHEYVVFMFMTNEPFGQNGAFFLLNGVLCVIQHLFQHVTGLGHTWGKGPLWNLLGWGVTLTILLKTSPLFVGTYARSGVMMLWPVPKILFDYFQSVI